MVASNEPLISLRGITKIYHMGSETIYALREITLDLQRNEYTAFMGPSGSGKSTLMNIFGCLDSPTSGDYLLNGTNVSRMSDSELAFVRNKEIGFVFQTFNLLPRLTALDNVALPLIYAGYSKRERYDRAKQALVNVQLPVVHAWVN